MAINFRLDSARVWFFSCLSRCTECEVNGKEELASLASLLFLRCKVLFKVLFVLAARSNPARIQFVKYRTKNSQLLQKDRVWNACDFIRLAQEQNTFRFRVACHFFWNILFEALNNLCPMFFLLSNGICSCLPILVTQLSYCTPGTVLFVYFIPPGDLLLLLCWFYQWSLL